MKAVDEKNSVVLNIDPSRLPISDLSFTLAQVVSLPRKEVVTLLRNQVVSLPRNLVVTIRGISTFAQVVSLPRILQVYARGRVSQHLLQSYINKEA
jgi:hypothetical protein